MAAMRKSRRRPKQIEGVRLEEIPISSIQAPMHMWGMDDYVDAFRDAQKRGLSWPENMPPLVVTDDHLLIDGAHRASSAGHAGWEHVRAVIVPQWTWDQWESGLDEEQVEIEGYDFDGYMRWLSDRSELFRHEVQEAMERERRRDQESILALERTGNPSPRRIMAPVKKPMQAYSQRAHNPAPAGLTFKKTAPKIPQDLIDDTYPRELLKQLYRPVAKSTELRPYGYQIVHWWSPKHNESLYEFIPNDASDTRTKQPPGPRITVHELESQIRFHKAIGAPLPKQHRLKPPVEDELTIKEAKHVYVMVDGSPASIAASLWVVAHARFDAVLVCAPGHCPAAVTISYLRAFAETFDLRFFEGTLQYAIQELGREESFVVTGDRKKKPPFKPVECPALGKSDAEIYAMLDVAHVRPHPAFVLGLKDPCMPDALMLEAAAQARRKKPLTFERALALSTISAGEYPADWLLYDEDEHREAV
jgi:hypothetical protein